jgi:hypothetical protein
MHRYINYIKFSVTIISTIIMFLLTFNKNKRINKKKIPALKN